MGRDDHDIDALLERLDGRLVIGSISGGKDSAAMSLYLAELGIDHDRVFLDTGWEHPLTYAYVLPAAEAHESVDRITDHPDDQDLRDAYHRQVDRYVAKHGEAPLAKVIGPVERAQAVETMAQLVVRKGMFMSRTHRFCTQELKVFAMKRHVEETYSDEVVNAVGIRAEESENRSKFPEWEYADWLDGDAWRPILRWTEADVVAIHHAHGLRPNELYLHGSSRVGCWPCIFARKKEIAMIADTDPYRIELIRRLEARVQDAAAARLRREGRDLREPRLWSTLVVPGADPQGHRGRGDLRRVRGQRPHRVPGDRRRGRLRRVRRLRQHHPHQALRRALAHRQGGRVVAHRARRQATGTIRRRAPRRRVHALGPVRHDRPRGSGQLASGAAHDLERYPAHGPRLTG